MNRLLVTLSLAAALAVSALAQNQPQPKSQAEVDAIMAVQNSQDPNVRIAAAQKLLKDFKDTEFKEFANYMMMLSYQQLNDFENMLIFGERTLEHNPDNVGVLIQLSSAIPLRTREFDLDKEEKLSKADDFAKRAMTLIPNMQKNDPNMTDDQWLLVKKDFMSQANEALGITALKRENTDEAVDYLMKAINLAGQQSGQTFYFLADAYQKQGKKTEAMNAAEKAAAAGDFSAELISQLKQKIEAM